MSEAELQKAVIDLLRTLGFLVAHFKPLQMNGKWWTPVQADGKGFPDIVGVKGRRLLFVELKSEEGWVKPDQRRWIDALSALTYSELGDAVEVYVWKPRHWHDGTIGRVLGDG